MNKHIKDLAIRAGYIPDEPTEEAFNEFRIYKFADLIIQEALDICDRLSEPFDDDDTATSCAERIREKFGIKK